MNGLLLFLAGFWLALAYDRGIPGKGGIGWVGCLCLGATCSVVAALPFVLRAAT